MVEFYGRFYHQRAVTGAKCIDKPMGLIVRRVRHDAASAPAPHHVSASTSAAALHNAHMATQAALQISRADVLLIGL